MEMLRFFAYNIAPTLATILISITYIPQIIKTYKTKSVEDLSLLFWVILNMFLLCMWTNSLFSLIDSKNIGYFITETINWGLALVVLIQILKYRKKKSVRGV
jgi:uncharacterized protein with PQ loop repeat